MSKKLELFKVPVLLVIIGCIIGLIRFFDFFVCSSSITYVKTEKMMFTPALALTANSEVFSGLRRVK